MSKSFYRLHRQLSLIAAIPVVLWALSGFLHPIMTTIRPSVKMQQLPVVSLKNDALRIAPAEALKRQNIQRIHDLRVVHIGPNAFYQVQIERGDVPVYLSTMDGQPLKNGDELYARHLARQFLEGNNSGAVADASSGGGESTGHACCSSATRWVMDMPSGAPVKHVQRVTAFNEEYDEIQRILPAHKVLFDRADGIRIYVETTQDRFVHAVDDHRATFDSIFGMFHTWDWAASLGGFRYVAMALLLAITFVSAIMGLWIFRKTRTIPPKGNPRLRWRFNHRVVSVIGSLFTLMFSFSGAFHAISKLTPDNRHMFHVDNDVSVAEISSDPFELAKPRGKVPVNFSLVRMNDSIFWRVISRSDQQSNTGESKPSWSKDRKTSMPVIDYYAMDGRYVAGGERKYAAMLAGIFAGGALDTMAVKPITKFEGEYGFVNKRLPVWSVTFSGPESDRYYIETSTGQLAVRVSDADLPEGYSFAFLHKHHFMDFGGKVARDVSTMFWAAMQVAMVLVGLIFYFKSIRRSKA